MEVDSDRLHPSIVSVSGIIHVTFIDLKEKRDILVFLVEALKCDGEQASGCRLLT